MYKAIENTQQKGFWDDIKSWFKQEAASLLAGAIGSALAGPVGGALAVLIVKSLQSNRSNGNDDLPAHIVVQLKQWSQNILNPYLTWALPRLNGDSPSYSSAAYTAIYNQIARELATLRAYYEFRKSIATSQDDVLLYEEKAWAVGKYIDMINQSYAEASSQSNPYGFSLTTFDAMAMDEVAEEQFNWSGAQSINVEVQILQLKEAGGETEPIIITKPTGGGNPKPTGGGKPKPTGGDIDVSISIPTVIPGGGNTQTPPFIPINTGGNTQTPPFIPTNGGPTNPPIQTVVTPRPGTADNTTDVEDSKKSKYVAYGGLALIAYVLLRK